MYKEWYERVFPVQAVFWKPSRVLLVGLIYPTQFTTVGFFGKYIPVSFYSNITVSQRTAI